MCGGTSGQKRCGGTSGQKRFRGASGQKSCLGTSGQKRCGGTSGQKIFTLKHIRYDRTDELCSNILARLQPVFPQPQYTATSHRPL